MILHTALLDTPIGPIIVIADSTALYSVQFLDTFEKLRKKTNVLLQNGYTQPIHTLKTELAHYFDKKRTTFTTPLAFAGTPFQRTVWKKLQEIPHGHTKSYAEIATLVDKPTAYRAVAQANGANPFCLVVPCHRVINSNGSLGGYSAGIERKRWLLEHELSAS